MAKQFIPFALGKSHPETTCTYEISVVLDWNLSYEYEQLCLPKAGTSDKGRLFQAVMLHF